MSCSSRLIEKSQTERSAPRLRSAYLRPSAPPSTDPCKRISFDNAESAKYCLRFRAHPNSGEKQHETQILVAVAQSPISRARNEGARIEKDFADPDEKFVGDGRPDPSFIRIRACAGAGRRRPRGADFPDG